MLPNPGGNICCQQHVIIKYLPHVAKQILILETLDKKCRPIGILAVSTCNVMSYHENIFGVALALYSEVH